MIEALQLYAFLILTFLGFVAPIITILISIFREGTQKLTTRYEITKSEKQSKLDQLISQQQTNAKKIDVTEIGKHIQELKDLQKTVKKETKNVMSELSYLNPQKQIFRLFLPLCFPFLCVVIAILIGKNSYSPSLVFKGDVFSFVILISLISFCYALFVIWKMLGIIVEVRKTTFDDQKESEKETRDLLSTLVEKVEKATQEVTTKVDKGAQDFLKEIFLTVNDVVIDNDQKEITVLLNQNNELRMSIKNKEKRIAKNIQIGFVFPTDLIIETGGNYGSYFDDESQIIRHEISFLHANTNLIIKKPLIVTPLKEGSVKIKTFIKAENIQPIYRNLTLKAIPSEINIVYHLGVDLYADSACTIKRQGVKGLILETISGGGIEKKFRIFPTTKTNYIKGKRVSWEWNLNKGWEQTWYIDPDTKQKKYAWREAGEFIGRHIDQI